MENASRVKVLDPALGKWESSHWAGGCQISRASTFMLNYHVIFHSGTTPNYSERNSSMQRPLIPSTRSMILTISLCRINGSFSFLRNDFKSLRPGEAFMRQWTKPSLTEIMSGCLFGVNDRLLWIASVGKISEIWKEIRTLSFKKMYLKTPSTKWRPFCIGFNVLISFCIAWSRQEMTGAANMNISLIFPHDSALWISHLNIKGM